MQMTMSSHKRFYLFGSALWVFAAYQAYLGDFVEMALYVLAGLAFGVNGLTSEPGLTRYKKPLTVLSWIFIFGTVIDFLYLIRYKP
jgi:hypothetical protein